jgi:hypothetical protein
MFVVSVLVTCFIFSADCTYEYLEMQIYVCMYVFTCLYNYIDIVLCTAYFVFVLTFPHPGLYWIYGNKDDYDDDDNDSNYSY